MDSVEEIIGSVDFGPALFVTVFVGLGVIIFSLLVRWIKQGQAEQANEADDKLDKAKNFPADASGKHRKKESTGTVKGLSKKKLSDRESRRTARANEKGFNHPWLFATLKGHSGRVLDMDFSANGKYLVSCADEDPDPGGIESNTTPSSSSEGSPSSSESIKESSSSSSLNPSPELTRGLSRRQRKNKKRDNTKAPRHSHSLVEQTQLKAGKEGELSLNNLSKNEEKKKIVVSPKSKVTAKHKNPDRQQRYSEVQPMKQFLKMTMSIDIFVRLLKEKYLLRREDMAMLRYPLRPEIGIYERKVHNKLYSQTCDEYHYDHFVSGNRRHHRLDANAVEFVPKNESADSGNGSSSSSEEENSGSEAGEYSIPSMTPKLAPGTIKWKDVRSHTCSRCGQFFYTTSKKYITTSMCFYHPGKLQTVNGPYGLIQHSCCKKPNSSPGCVSADVHVWAGPAEPVVNSSYVETEPPKYIRKDGNYGVYSLDCEMSYTVTGLEVVKVTLVDITGQSVYNEYVRPYNEVVDFNTKFSGVDQEDFVKNRTKSLMQVQRDLKRIICSETVLIGHGLENDLKGLKLLHKTVVDTSFVFPHFRGLPYRRSLKNLAQCCLNKDIQNGLNGHDSFEDARTCMELMLFRLGRDFPNL